MFSLSPARDRTPSIQAFKPTTTLKPATPSFSDLFYENSIEGNLDFSTLLNCSCHRVDRLIGLYRQKIGQNAQNLSSALPSFPDPLYDSASHFILRHAVSLTTEDSLLSVFASGESALFEARLSILYPSSNLKELKQLAISLNSSTKSPYPSFSSDSFDFKEVTDKDAVPYPASVSVSANLVDFSGLHVIKNRVYIPDDRLKQKLKSIFNVKLRNSIFSLREADKSGLIESNIDSNTAQLIILIRDYFVHKLNSASTQSLSLSARLSVSDIDTLHKAGGLPLCADVMLTQLVKSGHLKHEGRLSLGLTLKAMGLTLEESLHFWRQKMSKITDSDFEKNYAYNIKHAYGAVGGRKSYGPPSCFKMIDCASRPDYSTTFHGCPFRYMPGNKLSQALSDRLPRKHDVEDLVEMASQGRVDIACREFACRKFNLKKEEFHFEGPHVYSLALKSKLIQSISDCEQVASEPQVESVKTDFSSPTDVLPPLPRKNLLSPLGMKKSLPALTKSPPPPLSPLSPRKNVFKIPKKKPKIEDDSEFPDL
ncbi:hypothetical protein RCL1_004052 [Eukaryota sp. TZLM3-RCL]